MTQNEFNMEIAKNLKLITDIIVSFDQRLKVLEGKTKTTGILGSTVERLFGKAK